MLNFIQKFMIQLSEKDVILCTSMNKLFHNVNDGAVGLDAMLRILASNTKLLKGKVCLKPSSPFCLSQFP